MRTFCPQTFKGCGFQGRYPAEDHTTGLDVAVKVIGGPISVGITLAVYFNLLIAEQKANLVLCEARSYGHCMRDTVASIFTCLYVWTSPQTGLTF